jgi:DNA-nicking Smr family endonuclease
VCVCKNPPLQRGGFFVAGRAARADDAGVADEDPEEPVAIPITGELDLHAFQPAEVASLLDSYFAECQRRGLHTIRVIHGKGTGTLRTTVHAHLRRCPSVRGFAQGNETSGGWGATIVTLKPRDSC